MVGDASPALFVLAFSAGTATFFAPCAFPLLPGYVSYFLGETSRHTAGPGGPAEDTTPEGVGRSGSDADAAVGGLVGRVRRPLARAVLLGLVASAGIGAVYVGLAGTAVALGAQALADIAVLELVVGAVFVVAGGAMAAGWTWERTSVRLPERRRSVTGFFLFGVLYAGAAAGCTAPLFVAILLKGAASGALAGAGVAVAYALGTGAILVVTTVAVAVGGTPLLSLFRSHTARIYRAAGVLLLISGVAEIYYYFYGFPAVIPR
jgi:cytochrome c-type biogenesis protein